MPLDEYLATTQSALLREYLDRPVVGARAILPVAVNADWGPVVAADSPIDEVWLSAVAGRLNLAGSELLPVVGRDVKFGDRTAMIQVGTEWLMAERVKAADAPAYAERRRASVVYGPGNDGVIGRRMVGKQPLPVGREAVVPEATPA